MSDRRTARTRREEIARELEEVEARMSALVRRAELELRERMNPMNFVRHHPVLSFSTSTLAGVLLSVVLGRKESGGLIKKTFRAFASKWIARQVMSYLARKQEKHADDSFD